MQLKVSHFAGYMFLGALAALFLTLVSQRVSDSLPVLNFDTKSDF